MSIERLYTDLKSYLLFKKEAGSECVEFSVAAREKRVSCAEKRTPRIVCNYEYAKSRVSLTRFAGTTLAS